MGATPLADALVMAWGGGRSRSNDPWREGRRAGARRLGLRRWLDDESPARAFEHIAATTNRELAFLNKGPKTLGDQLGVPVARLYGLYGCLSGEPLGKRPLADIFTDGPTQCVQLAELALRQSALVNTPRLCWHSLPFRGTVY